METPNKQSNATPKDSDYRYMVVIASLDDSTKNSLTISQRVNRDGGRTVVEKTATVGNRPLRAGVGGQWLDTFPVPATPLVIRGKIIPRTGSVTLRRGVVVSPRASLLPRITAAVELAAQGAHAWVDADSEAAGGVA
jgi:hypothetical protein